MKDFKSYAQGGGNPSDGRGTNAADGQNGTNAQNADRGSVEQTMNIAAMLAKAMSGKSEGQILQTIISQAEQGKSDGTLTNADLDNFYNAVYPMLDGFKRQKLKKIIAQLKAI